MPARARAELADGVAALPAAITLAPREALLAAVTAASVSTALARNACVGKVVG